MTGAYARRGAHLGLLLLMGTMWGLQFAMLKLAAASAHAEIEILLLTLLALSLIFGTLLWLRGRSFRLTRARLEFLLVTGVLGYVLPLSAALYAATHIPAGVLALLASLTPVVAVALALGLRTERVSVPRMLAPWRWARWRSCSCSGHSSSCRIAARPWECCWR